MARPRAALVALAICGLLAGGSLLTAGGTTGRPHLWLTPSHAKTYTACVSSDCGPWSVTLNFQIPAFPNTTGYWLFLNGIQVGAAAASPFTFRGSDCNTTNTLGVEAHNGSGGHGPLWTISYTAPSCGSSGGATDFNALSSDPSFFPIGVWFPDAPAIATYTAAGMNFFESPSYFSSSDLSTIKSSGSVIAAGCSTSGRYIGTVQGMDGSNYTASEVNPCTTDMRGDPSESVLKAWVAAPDEPDTAINGLTCVSPTWIQNENNAIKAADDVTPKRPIIIDFNAGPAAENSGRSSSCHYKTDSYAQYMQNAGIATFDVYPQNYNGTGGWPFYIDSPAVGVKHLHTWMAAAGQDKPVFPILEATKIHASDVGQPTPADVHFYVWSSIIQGANGIVYWCIGFDSGSDLACLNNTITPGMPAQITSDDALIKSLGSVLNTSNVSPGASAPGAPFKVDLMTKSSGGFYYVFADADDPSGGTATISLPNEGSGTVTVLGESRTLQMNNGTFTDTFGGCSLASCSTSAVHIYQLPITPAFSCPSGVRCFYIANGGSDSNSGTSESAPWAHAPGMPTFTGTYAHQTGDEFIFKGGDTWGNSSFPLHPSAGGSSSHPDYYGIDQSWYDGANWSQPTFDAQGSNIGAGTSDMFFNLQGRDNVQVDDIHFAHWTASSITGGYGSCAVVNINGDLNVTVNRITVDGMSLDSSADAQNATCAVVFGNTNGPNFAGTSTLENSTITGGGTTYGTVAWSIANVENNTISGMPNNIYPSVPANGTGQISGNNISNCLSPSAPSGASNLHGDMILVDATGNPSAIYIHDNVLHDTGASGTNECESMWVGNPGETDYIWNNVLYNLHGTGQLKLNNNVTAGQTEGPYYIWNNTLEGASDGSDYCIVGHSGETTLAAHIQNNFCVSNTGVWSDSLCPGGGTACITADHNTLLSTSAAATDVTNGTLSNTPYQWAPTGSTSPTIQADGTSSPLTSQCAGYLWSLCSDTTYAGTRTVPGGYSTNTRPGYHYSWDTGAYQVP